MLAEKRYLISEEAGRGGMSVVYRVQDRRDHRIYAMKTIRDRPDTDRGQTQRLRLRAEAELMRCLRHPAIPRIHEILEGQGQLCLVMEYVEGISLAELLQKDGPQKEELVIEWGKQLCRVLAYLHEQDDPVIYRDLKPSNLLLTGDNRIHLIDFGAAGHMTAGRQRNPNPSGGRGRAERESAGVSRPARVWGTRGYAPPEQYAGYTDPRSDIYGLGITLYQLVTGTVSVESGGTSGEVTGGRTRSKTERKTEGMTGTRDRLLWEALSQARSKILSGHLTGYLYRRYVYRRYGVSPELQAILRRCTASRAADRYPNCRVLYQELCEIGEDRKGKKRNLFGTFMWILSAGGVSWAFWLVWMWMSRSAF